jgi:spoIIIJ-associated protein
MAEKRDNTQGEAHEIIDPVEYGQTWLRGVFERMNFDITVKGKIENDRLYFDASGSDADILLGVGTSAPKSIESIQTLLSAALARNDEKRQVFLDVRGWRDQRAGSLDGVAEELRDLSVRLGKKVTVAGFNSYERGVVHKAIEGDNRIQTESEGKGVFRKLAISPA